MKTKVVPIKTIFEGDRGTLSIIESERDIPFSVKRIYYITNVPCEETRGFHAHKTLHQFLSCPFGAVKVELDNGKAKEEVLLDSPEEGLYLSPDTWHIMRFLKENTVLLVAASDYYDENDYIRDYGEFLNMVEEGFWKK